VWSGAKTAAAAAAIALVLSASPVQAKDGDAFLKFPDNAAGEAVSCAFHSLHCHATPSIPNITNGRLCVSVMLSENGALPLWTKCIQK
jgi:hypothetical protein